jgi:hypothetical protein
MSYTLWFLICLGLTVLAIVATVVAGRQAERHRHLRRALTTIVLLGLTVVFAVLMARHERTFPDDVMRIHRVFSISVSCILPLVAISGIMLWTRPEWRRVHRVCVAAFLLAALGASLTGVWMLSLSELRG